MATQNIQPNELLSQLIANQAAVTLSDPNAQGQKDPFQLAFLKQIEQFGADNTLQSFWPAISGSSSGSGMTLGNLPYSNTTGKTGTQGAHSMSDQELQAWYPGYPTLSQYENGTTGVYNGTKWTMTNGVPVTDKGVRLGTPGYAEGETGFWKGLGDFAETVAPMVLNWIVPYLGTVVNYQIQKDKQISVPTSTITSTPSTSSTSSKTPSK